MVIKQEVFVLLNTTAKQRLQHRTLDSVVLALMVLEGQHGSVALEGTGGQAKDCPKQHRGAQPCPSTMGEG